MNKTANTRSLPTFMVILFLFTFFTSLAASSPDRGIEIKKLLISKKDHAPSQADIQLPYQEREKEEENEAEGKRDTKSQPLLVDRLPEGIAVAADFQFFSFYQAPRCCGNASALPIYLATRQLLI